MIAANGNRPLFISGSELLSRETKIEYLIDGIIESNTTGLIFGPPGGGKTFIILDIALCVATGESWNGRKVAQGNVIYFCAEGNAGIPRRIQAWLDTHGMKSEDLHLLHVSTGTIDFSQENKELVTKTIQEISKNNSAPISLIIIDTLARHMPAGDDENSNKDMSKLIRLSDSIRENVGNCVVNFVHHTGNSSQNRARGASALTAALDYAISCNSGELTFTKMKDAETPKGIRFKIVSVNIGKNGEDLSSAVIEYSENSAKPQKGYLTKNEANGLEILIETCVATGSTITNTYTVTEKMWQENYYQHSELQKPGQKQHSMNAAYNRMKATLIRNDYISVTGKEVILLLKEHQQIVFERINPKPAHGT